MAVASPTTQIECGALSCTLQVSNKDVMRHRVLVERHKCDGVHMGNE